MRFRAKLDPTPRRRIPGGVWTAIPVLLVFLLGLASASPAATPSNLIAKSPGIPSLPANATADGVVEDGESQLRARLLVSSGPERRVGVLFDLEPGWHLYWRNPGGTGIAPELGLDVPGHEVGPVAWPAPQTFEEADGLFTTWGYEGSVLLSAPLEAAADPAQGSGRIEAHPRVLVCRTQCVPAEFTLSSPLTPKLTAADRTAVDALFSHSVARVPPSAASFGIRALAEWTAASPAEDENARAHVTVETCDSRDSGTEPCPAIAEGGVSSLFIPMEGETFEYTQAELVQANRDLGRFVISVEATRLEAGADRLWGLLPVRDAQGRIRHVEIDVPIEATASAAVSGAVSGDVPGDVPAVVPAVVRGVVRGVVPTPETTTPSPNEAKSATPISGARWVQIFFLALLGGLILNGMPCVLPVLAIKVFAIADMAEKDPREVRLHGLAYTAGVLGSMAMLSVVVLGLRAAGHSVGWGFQFQEPLFVAAISALLVTFALNLFGIFEIELGQGKLAAVGQQATGLRRSTFEGLLAVVLATPCTAPFLGTAVGFAFASSGFGIAAIFLAIGLGLASPFLVVSFVPNLARFIPKSGPWMNALRSGLGFSLLATVVWLLWILGQSGGAEAVVSMTGVLLLLAFLLWGFGQVQPLRGVWLGRASAVAIAGLAFVGFNLIEFDRAVEEPSASASQDHEARWQVYSEAAVAEALAAGQPAFVVFTADWCITCQVNERTVLDRATIRDALAERNFALFKADWTRRDELIRTKLAEFGRAGVPLYLVYRPDRPNEPIVLSELLSQGEVLTALAVSTDTRKI